MSTTPPNGGEKPPNVTNSFPSSFSTPNAVLPGIPDCGKRSPIALHHMSPTTPGRATITAASVVTAGIASNPFAGAAENAGASRLNRFVSEPTFQIVGERPSALITSRLVLFQALKQIVARSTSTFAFRVRGFRGS